MSPFEIAQLERLDRIAEALEQLVINDEAETYRRGALGRQIGVYLADTSAYVKESN